MGPKYLGTSTVLAGGVLLYATNEFLTISLLPSAVADIGGQRLYAWVTTVYLVTSVAAATTVSALVARFGPRWSYLLGYSVFGIGSVMCALAPTMEFLLAGRVVQGGAGGLLAGLGLRGDQCRSAAMVVDQGLGVGLGDVGCRHPARSGRGWTVRAVRCVAMGVRRAGGVDRRDGHPGADRAAEARRSGSMRRGTSRSGRCCCSAGPRCW